MKDLLRLLLAASVLTVGCASSTVPASGTHEDKGDSDVTKRKDDGKSSDGASEADAPTTSDGTTGTLSKEPAGLVVIDLQTAFFDIAKRENATIDTIEIRSNAAKLMQAAGAAHRPVIVTYEATKSGDHAMPSVLKNAEPAGTTEVVKTTFGATGLPAFVSAIEASGLKRWVVVGAETDVCVLQTMMGLRDRGFEVVAVSDALMSEEVNVAPALRRYQQAGISSVTTDQAVGVFTGGGTPAAAATAKPKILRPLETGIVLNDVQGLNASDANAAQKKARLHELFLLTEWFKLPVFAVDPAATTSALPADLKSLLTKPIVKLADRPAKITQVAIAGGSDGLEQAVAGLGSDVWIVSDAIFGTTNTALEPLYVKGAVPSTYKSLYYELTVSVDDGGWPSQQWVKDGEAKYWDATQAPEDLPPLTP